MSSDDTFASVDDTKRRLAAAGYLPDARISTAALLCARLDKPLLVEGPAGVGKTALALGMAEAQGRELIRLQCYEGLDESRALYEWEYGKQLLYTQVLRDKISEVIGAAGSIDDAVAALDANKSAFFSEHFLLPRPLLQAIRADAPVVLLIDEVDKSDPEFEAFLLEVLSDFQVTIPELGTLRARHRPQVVLTSNNTRELSDALKRRCLHLTIPMPDAERELGILRAHVPDLDDKLARAVVGAVHHLRGLDLRKVPSISEVIDWARALKLLGRSAVDPAVLDETLGVLLKHADDVEIGRAARGETALAAQRAAESDG
jgi:MoxR-like ATPase